jgi:hypothetical protein
MKKNYEAPEAEILTLNTATPVAQVPIGGDASGDGDAKGNDQDVVEDEDSELAAPIKDKWEDLSEKKNGK